MPDSWKLLGSGSVILSNLDKAAKQLLIEGIDKTVWLLHGEMGSGKTTLVKQLVKEIGIEGHVTSPTFSIVNEYDKADGGVVYHFDMYRLKKEVEALDFGFEEYLSSGNLCLIEWPEKVSSLLPNKYFEVRIDHHDSVSRNIYFRSHE